MRPSISQAAQALALGALLIGAAPLRAADPMTFMNFFIGTWNCESRIGNTTIKYTATYSHSLNGSAIRGVDQWPTGGDEIVNSYVRPTREWQAVVMEQGGSVTIFRAKDTGAAHIAYGSTYPDRSMKEVFDRLSMTKYTLHFDQKTHGKEIRAVDVCTKT